MIPKYSRKRMAIHLHDSTDFEDSILAYILTIGLNIPPTIVLRINDVRYLARKHTPISCAILYLYRLPQHHSPVNYFLNGHYSQCHRMNNCLVVEKVSHYSFH